MSTVRGGAVFADDIRAVVQRARHVTRVHHHDTVGSTNAEALELAKAGAPHGTLVIADRQTAGRGRQGRRWESPPGVGLWFSWVLRPELELSRGFLVTALGALAVAEATGRLTGRAATVRWPNDVLVGRRKLAGVLAEARGQGSRLEAVVLGIGVNVGQRPGDFPEELAEIATSMAIEADHDVDRVLAFRSIVESFEQGYDRMLTDGGERALGDWRASMSLVGERVRLALPGGEVVGRVVAIADDGALVLEDDAGMRTAHHAGDVRRLMETR
jgi:BirA family biotin operon repressor/biotin-[acetyl-CoA-carboxylase] ligase